LEENRELFPCLRDVLFVATINHKDDPFGVRVILKTRQMRVCESGVLTIPPMWAHFVLATNAPDSMRDIREPAGFNIEASLVSAVE
jgi:hypothetical protein